MSDWKTRLRDVLEPILSKEDPRPDISTYDSMPACIFLYDAESEFELRQELALLKTRLALSNYCSPFAIRVNSMSVPMII